jgi:ferredoxin
MDKALFYRRFAVPEAAYPVIDRIVSPPEQRVIARLEKECFTPDDIGPLLWEGLLREGFLRDGETARDFAEAAYRRGIFSVVTEAGGPEPASYRLSNFYGRLDVFVVDEPELYRSFDPAQRRALDDWYFDAYYEGLSTDPAAPPTGDAVLTLAEVLDRIENDPRQLYLAPCDCRSLSGDCGKPRLTCLSYRAGPNTFAGRGLAKPISREAGKQVALEAERAGLMHTAGPNGICNCCGDCCYLFRARKRRGSGASWPLSRWVIAFSPECCINCGKCIKRCHLGVFEKKGSITPFPERCAGCGLCVSSCPSGALALRPRTDGEAG